MNSDYSDHDGYAYLEGNQEPGLTDAEAKSLSSEALNNLRKLTADTRRETLKKKQTNRKRNKEARKARKRNRR